ncbi:hypothetical protein [uncultured Methylobacterium sp.]|uniref:hypothetical protein n=1 Tax=uncultured Methylobacterium sp. TaxID=157278 RepID=UPI0035CB527D
MMSVTIDPSETRRSPQALARRATSPVLRNLVLGVLGSGALVGFSVGAYSMMGEFARPQLAKVAIGRQAAEWPDLKDGLPAMVSSTGEAARPPSRNGDAENAGAKSANAKSADVKSTSAALALPAVPVAATVPDAPPRNAAASSPRPLPPIETATVVASVRIAPLVPPAAMASPVPPSRAETVRARAAETQFTALPADPSAQPSPRPVKKAPMASARAKPVPGPVATPQTAVAAQPAEPEETEVFGIKVPTLASSGRKFVEGVQSLGDAVAKQF